MSTINLILLNIALIYITKLLQVIMQSLIFQKFLKVLKIKVANLFINLLYVMVVQTNNYLIFFLINIQLY